MSCVIRLVRPRSLSSRAKTAACLLSSPLSFSLTTLFSPYLWHVFSNKALRWSGISCDGLLSFESDFEVTIQTFVAKFSPALSFTEFSDGLSTRAVHNPSLISLTFLATQSRSQWPNHNRSSRALPYHSCW